MSSVHVAVGVILSQKKVLLAKRAQHQHQGGLWEFPGGKVEVGEHVTAALNRELKEELAINATQMQPLIQIRHDYGDKVVLLDVWTVTAFDGEPSGQEGQPLVWADLNQLIHYNFPAANRPIVSALTLPRVIAVTPSSGAKDEVLSFCQKALALGADGFQLRSLQLGPEDINWLHSKLTELYGVPIWINSAHLFENSGVINQALLSLAAHVHFTSRHLVQAKKVGSCIENATASCHNLEEIRAAEAAGIKAVYLSPVSATPSHPDANGLGWDAFSQLVAKAKVPVYALGGMALADLPFAQNCYAQGIAGISLFQFQP